MCEMGFLPISRLVLDLAGSHRRAQGTGMLNTVSCVLLSSPCSCRQLILLQHSLNLFSVHDDQGARSAQVYRSHRGASGEAAGPVRILQSQFTGRYGLQRRPLQHSGTDVLSSPFHAQLYKVAISRSALSELQLLENGATLPHRPTMAQYKPRERLT